MSEKVSYVKEAFKEPMNIWAMVMFVALAVFLAINTIPLLAWFAFWMPLAAGAAAERGRRREELIQGFDPREREAVEYLRWMKNQIYSNYQKFTRVSVMPDNINKLDFFWESYVDLLDVYRRRKYHMRSINRQTIQNQIQQSERAMANAPDEDTRMLYEKNLEILNKRLQTYTDIERSMKRVEAQLLSIESFFALVNDQVITMPTPEHISSLDFESLLSSIEMTKEILEETAPVLSQLDAAERSSSQSMRPPVPQRQ